jgi:very-short-patch-repair endonuclease
MFDRCLIDNKSKAEIISIYPSRKNGAYYINKFENYLLDTYQITLKEYCKKYLLVVWPVCPVKKVEVGWRPSGKGVILQLCAKGGVTREFFPKFDSFCRRISKERLGAGNPMYKKEPWNLNKRFSEAICHKMAVSAAKRHANRIEWGPTDIEIEIARILTEIGESFEEQRQIDFYCVDFVLKNKKIIIEADGDFWHCNPQKYPNGPISIIQKKSLRIDKAKTTFLRKKGWTVLRYWGSDILTETFKKRLLADLEVYDKTTSN